MSIPSVSETMTPSPLTIGQDQSMSVAHDMMRSHKVRHLPVLQGGRIVGIVSDGDLHLIETLDEVDPDDVTVEEAMTADPYCIAPETPLDEVVQTMADNKYGCAVVAKGSKVLGILTTTDVCRAFAAVLRERQS